MLSVTQVGEVRVAEDSDFRRLKALSDDTEDWKLEHQKGNLTVWTKTNQTSSFKIVKVQAIARERAVGNLFLHKSSILWSEISWLI